ncbi:hypothetical protein ACMYSQ_007428 [Aspergillus niger]
MDRSVMAVGLSAVFEIEKDIYRYDRGEGEDASTQNIDFRVLWCMYGTATREKNERWACHTQQVR